MLRHAFFLAFLMLSLIATGAACAVTSNSQPTATPAADIEAVVQLWSSISETPVSPEKNTIVEVWNSLSEDYVGKGEMDARTLSQAAMDAMLEVQRTTEGKVDPDVLSQAAIEAMLKALGDPYTSFLDANEYKLYAEDSQGNFEGIGARVNLVDDRLTIVEPLPNTPAERAGIRAGDVVLEVDGISTEGWSVMESVLKIRGPKGTSVRLLVQHQDAQEPVLIEVVRWVIQLDSIRWEMLSGDIAYVEIETFAENTDELLADSLKEIEKGKARGIVLDVRNNFGGLLSTTVNMASEFLKDGLVLYSVDGNGDRTDYRVRPDGLTPDTPLVVLTNGHSASASEVLSGALQDHGRAVLIGTRTFGKGSVNQSKRLSDGSGLYVTVAHWYTPNGRLIEGKGLEPDIWVDADTVPGNDPQLERALEYLGAPMAALSR